MEAISLGQPKKGRNGKRLKQGISNVSIKMDREQAPLFV